MMRFHILSIKSTFEQELEATLPYCLRVPPDVLRNSGLVLAYLDETLLVVEPSLDVDPLVEWEVLVVSHAFPLLFWTRACLHLL